jgi:hypothetical protein
LGCPARGNSDLLKPHITFTLTHVHGAHDGLSVTFTPIRSQLLEEGKKRAREESSNFQSYLKFLTKIDFI